VLVDRVTTTGVAQGHLWASSVTVNGFNLSGGTGDGTTSANTIVGDWVAIDVAKFT
jgi:hypothetical protein